MAFTFQSEKPADKDAFPGGSHERIAHAMAKVVEENNDIQIIGLDGEFGSGKSSILNMFSTILKRKNPEYKTWTFDCEQNYQGSIKSNFLELFSADVLSQAKDQKVKKQKIEEIRDIALGKRLDYTKKTKSKISAWAIVFFISILFSSSAIRELIGIITGKSNLTGLPYFLIMAISISPIIVLLLAKTYHLIKKETEFTLWGIIKGNSVDEIKERIDIGKEVSTVELKKSLGKILEQAENTRYIIIIDNLDRLPKEALRSVWSDLEIFTSAASESSFKIIVPFSSIKVAMHLSELSPGDSDENAYDAKDFISKKFPIVFNTPPIITSGWKSHFSRLWTETFGAEYANEANLCATLIHRHAPTPQKIVTPRFQKKFFNDLQTTLLTSENQSSRLAICAYILICRYNNIPLQQFLSEHSKKNSKNSSEEESSAETQSIENEIQLTRSMLTIQFGNDLKGGWPSTVLQIHYQTTYEIAISELIETPIQTAIESGTGEHLATLVYTFGFNDALRKILVTQSPSITLVIKSAASAIKKIDDEQKSKELIDILNNHYHGQAVTSDQSSEDESYFESLAYLTGKGLNNKPFAGIVSDIHVATKNEINLKTDAITEAALSPFVRYDNYLSALRLKAEGIFALAGNVFVNIIVPYKKFKTLNLQDFRFSTAGYADAIKNVLSNEEVPLDKNPTDYDTAITAISTLLKDREIGGDEPHKNTTFYLSKSETTSFLAALASEPSDTSIWLGLLLSNQLDASGIATVSTSAEETDDLICKTIAVIILLKHENISAIDSVAEATKAMDENQELAYVLAKATCSYEAILGGLKSSINSFCTRTLIRAYESNEIKYINPRKSFEEYKLFLDSAMKEGRSKSGALGLLETYKHLLPEAVLPIKGLPSEFIEDALSMHKDHESGQLIRNYYLEKELTIENWKEIIIDQDNNIDLVISHLNKHGEKVPKSAPLRDAIIQTLASTEPLEENNETTFNRCIQLSQLLNLRVSNNFSSDLRRLVLDVKLPDSYRFKILENFGGYISVFTPESLSEYEALSKLIELALGADSNDKVVKFIEMHSKDIHQYAIPDRYLAAFAHQDEEIQRLLPRFYSKLKSKRAFKAEKRNISKAMEQERKALEKNEKLPDLAPIAPDSGQEAPEAPSPSHDEK